VFDQPRSVLDRSDERTRTIIRVAQRARNGRGLPRDNPADNLRSTAAISGEGGETEMQARLIVLLAALAALASLLGTYPTWG
jgi:hypothetical protein